VNVRLYPLFLNLRDRVCVVVGGTEVAEGKIRELLDAGAKIVVIAPSVTDQIAAWSQARTLQWQARPYKSGDLRAAFLVASAAGPEINSQVFEEAEKQHTWCNAVDDTAHCNCYASAVVRRGALQIAVSTEGKSPALAQRLRKELEQQFSAEYALWVERLGELRSRLLQDDSIDGETRRRILHEQASAPAFQAFRDSLEPGRRQNSDGEPDGWEEKSR
jgi:precorrin-2 dehydrogenase/sirohydrochlorin ferrochelatase